ncbi:hypothetical protein Hanom_Chr05g00415261 [Helianthus anomalus]
MVIVGELALNSDSLLVREFLILKGITSFIFSIISNTTALHSNSQEFSAITHFCTIVILVPSLLSSRFVNLVYLI